MSSEVGRVSVACKCIALETLTRCATRRNGQACDGSHHQPERWQGRSHEASSMPSPGAHCPTSNQGITRASLPLATTRAVSQGHLQQRLLESIARRPPVSSAAAAPCERAASSRVTGSGRLLDRDQESPSRTGTRASGGRRRGAPLTAEAARHGLAPAPWEAVLDPARWSGLLRRRARQAVPCRRSGCARVHE